MTEEELKDHVHWNEPAFPTQMWDEELKEATWLDGGLTKRELFACAAMQGFCSNHPYLKQLDERAIEAKTCLEKALAAACVSYADALLKELSKEKA